MRKKGFLQAYDLCYLWAADEVIKKVNAFIDLLVEHTAKPNPLKSNQTQNFVCRMSC